MNGMNRLMAGIGWAVTIALAVYILGAGAVILRVPILSGGGGW